MARFMRQAQLRFGGADSQGESSTDEEGGMLRGGFGTRTVRAQLDNRGSLWNFHQMLLRRLQRSQRRGGNARGLLQFVNTQGDYRSLDFDLINAGTFLDFMNRIALARQADPTHVSSGLFTPDNDDPYLLNTDSFRLITTPGRRVRAMGRRGRVVTRSMGLGEEGLYFDPETPWVYQGEFEDEEDDGRCLERVLERLAADFGVEELPSHILEEITKGTTREERAQFQIRQLELYCESQGRQLVVVNPMLPHELYWEPFNSQARTNRVSLNGKEWHPFVKEDVLPLENTDVVVLFDGRYHVDYPVLRVEEGTGRRLLCVEDGKFWYRWKGANIDFGVLRVKNRRVRPPFDIPFFHALEDPPSVYPVPKEWRIRSLGDWHDIRGASNWCNPKELDRYAHVFFDFETVPSFGGGHHGETLLPYSVSYLVLETDSKGTQQTPKEDFDGLAEILVGPNCADEFLDVIFALRKVAGFQRLSLISFNGANFDNYLVLQALSKRLKEVDDHSFNDDPHLSGVFFNGSSLMNMRIDGFITCFDLARHLVASSLDSLCKNFNTLNRKQTGTIDHQEVARRFRERGWAFLNDEDFLADLRTYNNGDVTSLAELYYVYTTTNPIKRNVEKEFPGTIGSLTFNAWKEEFEQIVAPYLEDGNEHKELKVCHGWEALEADLYWGLRESILAGRVELFNGPQLIEEDPVMSLDVTSLYPYVMSIAPVYYPFGYVNRTGAGQFHPAGKLGFYRVSVDQSMLPGRNLPMVLAHKERNAAGVPFKNHWNATHVEDIWIGTPVFELLHKLGARVGIHEGFYYSHKMKSCEMFSCLTELMREKNRQDRLKAARDPEYNPAMRQMCKLGSNSLYGKMIEGLHLTLKRETTAEEFDEVLAEIETGEGKYEKINTLDVVGRMVFAEFRFKKDAPRKLAGQRPIGVGMFILEYARCYMYEHAYAVLGLDKLLYTDTDCFKFLRRDFPVVQTYMGDRLIPHWAEVEESEPAFATQRMWQAHGKQYGSFEDELPEGNTGIALVAKKFYAVLKGDEVARDGDDPQGSLLLGAKGVRMNDVILTQLQVLTLEGIEDGYERLRAYQQIYEEEGAPRIRTHGKMFFKELLVNRQAFVLTNGLRRVSSNLKKGVLPEDEAGHNAMFGQLMNMYMMKAFRPKGIPLSAEDEHREMELLLMEDLGDVELEAGYYGPDVYL